MIEIKDIPKEKISRVRNIWEKLNKMHYEDSIYFEDHYESLTFEESIECIMKINDGDLKISVLVDGPRFLGYCISSINAEKGEIDSIYIDEDLRDRGFGKTLMRQHISWMKDRGCTQIGLAVSFGHDSVLDFFHKMGLYERLIYFELKDSM
jgi:ribosomal protein S18 acetylase RimI-like enzyme